MLRLVHGISAVRVAIGRHVWSHRATTTAAVARRCFSAEAPTDDAAASVQPPAPPPPRSVPPASAPTRQQMFTRLQDYEHALPAVYRQAARTPSVLDAPDMRRMVEGTNDALNHLFTDISRSFNRYPEFGISERKWRIIFSAMRRAGQFKLALPFFRLLQRQIRIDIRQAQKAVPKSNTAHTLIRGVDDEMAATILECVAHAKPGGIDAAKSALDWMVQQRAVKFAVGTHTYACLMRVTHDAHPTDIDRLRATFDRIPIAFRFATPTDILAKAEIAHQPMRAIALLHEAIENGAPTDKFTICLELEASCIAIDRRLSAVELVARAESLWATALADHKRLVDSLTTMWMLHLRIRAYPTAPAQWFAIFEQTRPHPNAFDEACAAVLLEACTTRLSATPLQVRLTEENRAWIDIVPEVAAHVESLGALDRTPFYIERLNRLQDLTDGQERYREAMQHWQAVLAASTMPLA